MRRERLVQVCAVGVLIACLVSSQAITTVLAASAGRHRLVFSDSAEEGDPPEVALGIAIGAFRGLFVNMLWMRANERKNEGRYYDAVDLARTITRLQPRFPRVWAFHAWNLAYNISVATNTQGERWNWVNQGIRLLREEGIPKNPNELLLYKELAWLFLHKVQGVMDDANGYYKRRFAEEWTAVMGAPPPRGRETMAAAARVEQLIDRWMGPVAAGIESQDELRAAFPAVVPMIDQLRDEAGIDLSQKYFDDRGQGPGEKLLRNFEITRSGSKRDGRLRPEFLPADANVNAIKVFFVTTEEDRLARNALINHVRKKILREKYHMEPENMIACMRMFGPLDWRHPASHAIYWCWRGVGAALLRVTEENRKNFDFLNTDRMLIHGIQEMYRSGEIIFDINSPEFFLAMPSADFIGSYTMIVESADPGSIRDRGGQFYAETRVYTTYAAGYENFLRDVVRFLYRRGQRAEAEAYQIKLLTWTKHNQNNPGRVAELSKPLDVFVRDELTHDDRFIVPDVALSEIVGSLQSAYTEGLLNGNADLFRDSFEYAQLFHAIFAERQIFNVNVNQGDRARMEAIIDRDFQVFAGQVLAAMIRMMGGVDGEMMYAAAPQEIKAAAWVLLERSPENDGATFPVRFPPPPDALVSSFKERIAARDARLKSFQGALETK